MTLGVQSFSGVKRAAEIPSSVKRYKKETEQLKPESQGVKRRSTEDLQSSKRKIVDVFNMEELAQSLAQSIEHLSDRQLDQFAKPYMWLPHRVKELFVQKTIDAMPPLTFTLDRMFNEL